MVPENGPDISRAIFEAYSRVTCVAVILALKTICIEILCHDYIIFNNVILNVMIV